MKKAPRAWLWILFVSSFGFFFWLSTPARKIQDAAHPFPAWSFPWNTVIVAVVWFLVTFALVVLTAIEIDRDLRRAVKRANAGDVEGAIDDLREQIETKGVNQRRANVLGLLLAKQEKWDESASLFRKAEELGTVKGVCQANLGHALRKAGRPEQALPVLEEAALQVPLPPALVFVLNFHLSQVLADLGRWDEAHARFRLAESARSRALRWVFGAPRQDWQSRFDQFRERLASNPERGTKPAPLHEI